MPPKVKGKQQIPKGYAVMPTGDAARSMYDAAAAAIPMLPDESTPMLPDAGTRGGPLTRDYSEANAKANTKSKANKKAPEKANENAPSVLGPTLSKPALILSQSAPKAPVSKTVLPPQSLVPLPITQVTKIPDQETKDKNIEINYAVIGGGSFLAEQISSTQLNSASLADATQASIDVTTKVTTLLGLASPNTSGLKLTRGDASSTYDETLSSTFASIQGNGLKVTIGKTNDTIGTLLSTVVGPTAVKAIMDSGCWGETFRLYLDADMFERTSITEDKIEGLLTVYGSQSDGLNILRWLLRMSYCPVFELVSSDKLGAFNGLYTLELLNRLFPVVATLNIPKGSGGQVGIDNEVYIYSIILAAVLTDTPIQTLLPPQAATELDSVFGMIGFIKTQLTHISQLNLNSFLANVKKAMASFSNNGGIANSQEELDSIWSTNVFMYMCVPGLYKAIDSVLNNMIQNGKITNRELFFQAIEHSYFAQNDQQKFIAVAEEFTWFAFQMTRYKKTEDVYSGIRSEKTDPLSIFREERTWYKQKLNTHREAFETEWPQVLTKVYLNEAYFGHDNKSKTLTEFASRADFRVKQIIDSYKMDTRDNRPLDQIPWDNFEKWIIKKCQRDNKCMVFEACRVIEPKAAASVSLGTHKAAVDISEAKTVSGVSFGTNTDMGFNNTINYTVPVQQPTSSKKESSKESFSAGGGNPVNTLLTVANIGCKVVVTTYDLENYVSAEAMYQQGAAEYDTMLMQWSSNVILNELMRRRIPDYKILEVQGILSTLDRASRTNNPGAIYATGHLIIPILILENPELILQINYMVGIEHGLLLWQESLPETDAAFASNNELLESRIDKIDPALLIQLSDLNYLISFMLSNAVNRTDLTNNIRQKSEIKDVFNITKQLKTRTEVRPAENSKTPSDFEDVLKKIFKRSIDQTSLDQKTVDTIARVIQEMATQYIDQFDVPVFISKGGQQTLSHYISDNDFWNYYLTYMVGRNKKIAKIMFYYITHARKESGVKQFTAGKKMSQLENVLNGPDYDDLALIQGWDYSQEVRLNAALFEIIGDLVKSRSLGVDQVQEFFGKFQYGSDGSGTISELSGINLKEFLIKFFKDNRDLYKEIVMPLAPEVDPEVLAAAVLSTNFSESQMIDKIIGFVELVMSGNITLASISASASAAVPKNSMDRGHVNQHFYDSMLDSAGLNVQEQYDNLSGQSPIAIMPDNSEIVNDNFEGMLYQADKEAGYIPGSFALGLLQQNNSTAARFRLNSASSDEILETIPLSRQASIENIKRSRTPDSDNDSDSETSRGKQSTTEQGRLQNEIDNNNAKIYELEVQLGEARIYRDTVQKNVETNFTRNPDWQKAQKSVNYLKNSIADLEKNNQHLKQEIHEIEHPEEIQYSLPGTPYYMKGGVITNNSLKDLNGKPVIALYNKKEKKYYIISFEEYLKYWFNNQLDKIKRRNVAKGIKSTNLISKPEQKDPYGVLARREAVAAKGVTRPVNNLSNPRQLPFGRKEMTLANLPQTQSAPRSALVQSSTNSIRSRGGKFKTKSKKLYKRCTKRRLKKSVRKTKKRLNKGKRFSKRRKH